MMERSQRDGTIFILLSATGYSFFSIWVKQIQASGLAPLDIGLWRFLLAAPLFWLLVATLRQPQSERPLPRLRLMGMGGFLAIAAITAFYGLERLPASTFIVLFYTYPAMVATLSALLGDRLPPVGWLALALTFAGTVLTVPDIFTTGLSADDLLGVLLALLNAFDVAVYFILSGRLLRGHTAIARASAWSISGTLILMLLLAPLRAVEAPQAGVWPLLLGLAVVSTVFPVFFLNSGIQKVGPARAAIIGTIEPVQTLIWAALFLGERMQPIQAVGGLLIFASVVLLQAHSLRRARQTLHVKG